MKTIDRLKTTVYVLGLVLLAGAAAQAGTITGTITYEGKIPTQGKIPTLPPIDVKANPACHAMHSGPIKNEVCVLGEGQTLANVVVSVKSGLEKKEYPPSSEPVVLDQRGCVYIPHVVAIQAGQQLKILNSDNTMHNVHSLSRVNKAFNVGMLAAKPGQSKEILKTISKVEEKPFIIKCDVHQWMRAYVFTADHPFFAVTKEDGKFTIDGLPAGTYEIQTWHELLTRKSGPVTGTVTVTADGTATLDLTLLGPK